MHLPSEVERYKRLIDTARKLSSAMDLNALLHEILSSSQEVMAAEATSIFMPDHATCELVLHSAASIDKAAVAKPIRIPKGAGIAGAVFEGRKTSNIHDVQNDPRFYRKADATTGFVTRAMITVPLLSGEQCLGVVQAINPIGRGHFDEADEEILEGFASLIASTLIRLESQERELQDAKARQELELARDIQKSFLPPDLKTLDTCQVHFAYFPAREVGGDFYFVYPLDEHRTLMGLGDVSGKGVPAALTMARTTAEIKGQLMTLEDKLGDWVSGLNNTLVNDLHGGRFVGITFMLSDSRTSRIQVCTAGQYAPAWSDSRKWNKADCTPQLPLGIMEGYQYDAREFELKPGQIWLLFSDGITEARDINGEEYTEERFLKDLPADQCGHSTFRKIVDAWQQFTVGAQPHDDASFLMLDWRGQRPPDKLYMVCKTENLCNAREFTENWAKYAGFDDIGVGQIILACDEAITNIYRYAYNEQPGPVSIDAQVDTEALTFHIRDQGKCVELENLKGRELDDLRPGGLGIHLLKQVFQTVDYEPQNNGTLLTLKKLLQVG